LMVLRIVLSLVLLVENFLLFFLKTLIQFVELVDFVVS
jgi:hypothetical protein